jgi:hypothetical protein
VKIDEVAPIGTQLDVKITATDIDTDPDLVFSIDWDTSRATRQGFTVLKEEYEE